MAEAVLLIQRCFWVGTTDDPDAVDRHRTCRDNLFAIGFAHVAGGLVLLVVAQVVFARLESKIPERL